MNILVLGVVIALILSVGTFVLMFNQTQINILQVEINQGLIENDASNIKKWEIQVEVNELLIELIKIAGSKFILPFV